MPLSLVGAIPLRWSVSLFAKWDAARTFMVRELCALHPHYRAALTLPPVPDETLTPPVFDVVAPPVATTVVVDPLPAPPVSGTSCTASRSTSERW
jgi:hypothetical protein